MKQRKIVTVAYPRGFNYPIVDSSSGSRVFSGEGGDRVRVDHRAAGL